MLTIDNRSAQLLRKLNRLFRMRVALNQWEKRKQLLRQQLEQECAELPEPLAKAMTAALEELMLKGLTRLRDFDLSPEAEKQLLQAMSAINYAVRQEEADAD